MLKMVYFLKEG